MNADTMIPIIALALFPPCAAWVVVRRAVLLRRLGAIRSPFPRKAQLQFIGILACTPVLPLLNFARRFDALTQFAICGTGLLGFYIALYDLLLVRIGGIYENGLLWNAGVALFADVASFSRIDPRAIEVTGTDGARRAFAFPDESTADSAYASLETAVHPLP